MISWKTQAILNLIGLVVFGLLGADTAMILFGINMWGSMIMDSIKSDKQPIQQ